MDKNEYIPIIEDARLMDDYDEHVSENDLVGSFCLHRPGKFLGQTFSKNYERYLCANCGEEYSRRIENK